MIWSLTSLFGSWHPDWGLGTRALVAICAAVAFFASVLFHEMAHSLVARLYGIPVRDITLHMFGGVSNIEKEPPTPGAEFFMAVVGPLASIGLGIALVAIGAVFANVSAPDVETAADLVERMGPVATLVMWLGPVNVVVGLFNLIPGFPLDGGRILRSILWRATGSLHVATRWSTAVGQIVGWLFIVSGALMAIGYPVPFFGSGLAGGIWLALIGFFLRNAAVQHQAGQALTEEMGGVRVADLMRTQGPWVDARTPLSEVVSYFVQGDPRAVPVFDGGRFIGIVSITDLRRAGERPWAAASDVMTPRDRLTVTTPDTPLVDALRALGAARAGELPVMVADGLVGMLFERDVARWLELRSARSGPVPPLRTRQTHA